TLLAIGRSRKSHHTEYPRADPFSDGFDRSSLAGAVTSLEHDNDAQSLVLHPLLKYAELRLKPLQLFFVVLPLQLRLDLNCGFFVLHHLHLSEAPRTDGEQHNRKKGEGSQIRPERAPRRVLQCDTPDDRHQIAQGVEIRELLKELRHVVERGSGS